MASTSRSPVRGSCGRYPTEPDRRTEPVVGWAWPARTLASVVLPAPFRPTRPIRSPAATWKDALSSSRRAPARSSISVATIMIRCSRDTDGKRTDFSPEGPQSVIVIGSTGLLYVTGSGRAIKFRLGQPDANGLVGGRDALEHGRARVGNREEAVRGPAQVRGQPRVVAQPRDRPPVPAEDHRVQAGRAVPAEDPGRGVGGGPERHRGLVLPAPGEAVLGPPARRAPPVHQPAAGLRGAQAGRHAGKHADRVTAQAD